MILRHVYSALVLSSFVVSMQGGESRKPTSEEDRKAQSFKFIVEGRTTTEGHPYGAGVSSRRTERCRVAECPSDSMYFACGPTALWSHTKDSSGNIIRMSLNVSLLKQTRHNLQTHFGDVAYAPSKPIFCIGSLALLAGAARFQQYKDTYGLLGLVVGSTLVTCAALEYCFVKRRVDAAALDWDQQNCLSGRSQEKIYQQMKAALDPRLDFAASTFVLQRYYICKDKTTLEKFQRAEDSQAVDMVNVQCSYEE